MTDPHGLDPHPGLAPDTRDHRTVAGGGNRMDVTAERGGAGLLDALAGPDPAGLFGSATVPTGMAAPAAPAPPALSRTLADEDRPAQRPSDEVPASVAAALREQRLAEGPRVVALDLSIRATGRAWPDGTLATLTTSPDDPDDARVDSIAYRIGDDLDALGLVDLVAIEAGVYRSQAAFVLGMLHRAVRTECRARGIPYLLVPPASVKTYATGKGNCTKGDIRVELYKRTGRDIRDDNQADAWALRALVLDLLGWPVLELPKTHRRALDKLAVPAGYRGPLQGAAWASLPRPEDA